MDALPYIPDYIIESVLGEGGMATVYLGIQQKLQRKVAIKILDPALLKNKILADRFMIEAQTAANLNHPNIISIYDVGQVGKYYYIVMELLDGSLKDLIRSSRSHKLPPRESLKIISKIAPALDYAHKQGIIHRDIKPDNIMFRQDGTPVLVDFGIARAVDTDLQMTKTGMGIGTPHYMSPEQCQTSTLDGRSDFYSLGVVLYELLTGEKPYRADTIVALALKQINDPVPKLPPLMARYQHLLDKMMAKNKENRVQNGTELQHLIDESLREPVIKNGENTPANLQTNNIQTKTHPTLDLLVKPTETQKMEQAKPMESIKPAESIEPIKPVEPVEPVTILSGEEILDSKSVLEADAAVEAVERLRRSRFDDQPVPDWFKESLERTTAVESYSEQVVRKPYKQASKSHTFSRSFMIVLLITLMLGIFIYFFYQGIDSEENGQGSKTTNRKNISGNNNLPVNINASSKGKVPDNDVTGQERGKINNKEAGTPKGEGNSKMPDVEKSVLPPAMSDNDTFKNAAEQNTVEAYRKYLENYPSGHHADDVIARIAQLKEGISLQDLGKIKSKPTYSLRNVYHNLSKNDVESIIKRYGFYDGNYNTTKHFKNDFESVVINGNPVIIDHKTGLMWQPGGSDTEIEQKRIPRWFKELNGKQYAGYSDWRLPTLEEAASLLNESKNNKGLYIDPLFSGNQKRIWTGDQFKANNLWVVRFYTGIVLGSEDDAIHFIRPVRSMK